MKKTGLIKKAGQIAKAFTSDAPDTEWYTKRNAICDSCEWNSLNKSREDLSFSHKLVLDTVCGKVCTACGCCTEEKTKIPDAICGLIEIGQTPKWGAVTAKSVAKGVSVELLNPDMHIVEGRHEFEVQLTTELDLVKADLIFSGRELISAVGSCSCMTTFVEQLEDNKYKVNVDISTVAFSKEATTTRKLLLNFNKGRSGVDLLTVNFKINKK